MTTTTASGDALLDLLSDGSFNRAAAVGVLLQHLEENIAHPHDSTWPDDTLRPLEDALGDDLEQVVKEARALFAAKKLCRALQQEELEAGADDVTTIECSSQQDELEGLLDAFRGGFPLRYQQEVA